MRTQTIRSRENPNLELIAFHGHFATRHSHNSHYLDITRLKHEYSLAHDTALALANHYIYEKSIDTSSVWMAARSSARSWPDS